MNAFDYSYLFAPLAFGVTNLIVTSVLYRTIVRSSTLLRRRHFFESLALLAFVIALFLTVMAFALWRENPRFVLVCTGSWVLICLVAAGVVRRHGRRGDNDLALPDVWPTEQGRLREMDTVASEFREPMSPGPTGETHEHASPLDAFTRARLTRARRERSAGDGRFRNNRSVYKENEPGKRNRTDRE